MSNHHRAAAPPRPQLHISRAMAAVTLARDEAALAGLQGLEDDLIAIHLELHRLLEDVLLKRDRLRRMRGQGEMFRPDAH